MIMIISLLILTSLILGRPVDRLAAKLDGTDWTRLALDAWDKIVLYSKRIGRDATRPVLTFFYTMQDESLSSVDRALIYAAIIYTLVPRDFLPKSIFGWLGVIDDAGAMAFVYAKVKKSITPELKNRAEDTLSDWFGQETVVGFADMDTRHL